VSLVEQYTYVAPTRALRDWLRSQPGAMAALVGGPGVGSRIFATEYGGLLPGGADLPAVAFHRSGGTTDYTLDNVQFQFDCWAKTAEDAEALEAALKSLLASTPPRTRLTANLILEGPAVIVDSLYLPAQISRVPRQILRADLTFASF